MVKSGRAKLRDKKIQKSILSRWMMYRKEWYNHSNNAEQVNENNYFNRGQKKRFEKKLMIERRNNMIKSPIMKGDQKK